MLGTRKQAARAGRDRVPPEYKEHHRVTARRVGGMCVITIIQKPGFWATLQREIMGRIKPHERRSPVGERACVGRARSWRQAIRQCRSGFVGQA